MTTSKSDHAAERSRPRRERPVREARPRGERTAATWLLPLGLILLSAIPAAAGAVRLVGLSSGASPAAQGSGYHVPLVLHIAAGTLYSLLGAFQFSPGLRRARPRWHRAAGRMLVPLGLAAALSALWLTLFFIGPSGAGALLYAFRLFFGLLMSVSLVVGLRAILSRDVQRHRAWMTRAYAIGLGAGTQAFTQGFGQPLLGRGQLSKAVLMGAGWGINLAVAEWAIRRGAASR